MGIKKILFIIIATIALSLPVAAFAGDIALVQAEGKASKADDISEVKKRAMDQALRRAVLDSAKTLLARESLSAQAEALETVAASPRSYIVNYKIRSEGWITHLDTAPQEGAGTELYHIWIDASVDTDALRAALSKLVSSSESTGQVTINILDVRDNPTFRLIQASLGKIASIKELSYGSFANGRITLIATASGDASSIAARIARELPENFAVMEGAGQIIIRPSALVTR